MLRLSPFYKHYERIPLEEVYAAMQESDLSLCVLAGLRVLQKTNNFIPFKRTMKSLSESMRCLSQGKEALDEGRHPVALMYYNMALMSAPKNSEAMKLAYFSRAQLLYATEQYTACVTDVETYLSIDSSGNMAKKLRKLKEDSSNAIMLENFVRNMMKSKFADQFFELHDHNSDVPSVSSNIKLLVEAGTPKVVAAKDIPAGTFVAFDTAFVNMLTANNLYYSCYHCQKMGLNLIPCDGCCIALYCDDKCKKQDLKEGHNVECKIIDFTYMNNESTMLPFKAVLKMRHLTNTWEEFVSESLSLGVDRIHSSSLNEVFGHNPFALLVSCQEKHFVHGTMFTSCMYFANLIHYLDTKTSFLPESPVEKQAAICAISRVLMHLSLKARAVIVKQCISIINTNDNNITMNNTENRAYFPLIGKLKTACVSNAYAVHMKTDVALVTSAHIKKGDEITIPAMAHWSEVHMPEEKIWRNMHFLYTGTLCDCNVCNGTMQIQVLNDLQTKAFAKFRSEFQSLELCKRYETTCKLLDLLSDAPYSEEYKEVFIQFCIVILYLRDYKCTNVVMSRDLPFLPTQALAKSVMSLL